MLLIFIILVHLFGRRQGFNVVEVQGLPDEIRLVDALVCSLCDRRTLVVTVFLPSLPPLAICVLHLPSFICTHSVCVNRSFTKLHPAYNWDSVAIPLPKRRGGRPHNCSPPDISRRDTIDALLYTNTLRLYTSLCPLSFPRMPIRIT